MRPSTFSRTSTIVLGVGSIAFGVWALARPEQFANFMGIPAESGRLTGVRDMLIGAAILAYPGVATFGARAAADSWDARHAGKPHISRGAALFGTWALAAARSARRDARRQAPDASPVARLKEVYQ